MTRSIPDIAITRMTGAMPLISQTLKSSIYLSDALCAHQ